MEAFIEQVLGHAPYVGVTLVLLAGGFGFPLPEDIPLMVAGWLCGKGEASLAIMIPICLLAVFGGDSIMYLLGRRYGQHVRKLPVLRKYLSDAAMEGAKAKFHQHGGKTLFIARFTPGLRAPMFFSAGLFHIPYWKMVVYDGGAALISVPFWIFVAYYFARYFEDGLERLKALSQQVQLGIFVALGLIIAAVVVVQLAKWRRKQAAAAGQTGP